jgi:hypothetical protein
VPAPDQAALAGSMRQSAWCALLSCGLSCEVPALGIPAKLNAHSEGKPNSIPG